MHFAVDGESPLPTQSSLDRIIVGVLNGDGFVASLLESDDPSLTSVQSARAFLSDDAIQDDGTPLAPYRLILPDKGENKTVSIFVPMLVASLLLLFVIAAVHWRYTKRGLKAQENSREEDEFCEHSNQVLSRSETLFVAMETSIIPDALKSNRRLLAGIESKLTLHTNWAGCESTSHGIDGSVKIRHGEDDSTQSAGECLSYVAMSGQRSGTK